MGNHYETTLRVAGTSEPLGHMAMSAIRDGVEDSLSALEPDETGVVEIVSESEIKVTFTSPGSWGDVTRHLVREAIQSNLRGVLDEAAGETLTVDEIVDAEPGSSPSP